MTVRFWRGWLPRSLVGRVFALYSVTLLVFVSAGVGLFYSYQFQVELEDAQLRAEALTAVMQPTVTDSAVIGDYDTIRRTLERAIYHSSFASAAFIDLRGGVVRAVRDDPPDVSPPRWLLDSVAKRLYDANLPLSVGGTDYGVLRLSFAADRIAGRLWQQTRIALALGALSVVAGLLLIWYPLVRWLGKFSQVSAFEAAMQRGEALPLLPGSEDAPLEFRQTFAVLERTAASLRTELATRQAALVALRQVLEGLMPGAVVPPHAGGDELAAVSALISELVVRLQVRGAQLDAIFALSPDGFVSFDAERRVNYVSPAFTLLTGLSEPMMRGRTEHEVEANLRSQCAESMPWRGMAALRDEGTDASARRERLEIQRPVRRVLEVALRVGHSAAISQVLSLRDVTHESLVEQMKSEFLSTAAHELRTPMSSIHGFVELIRMRPMAPERQQEVLEIVHRQSQLMIAIINELLDLARIEARRGKDFQVEVTEVGALLDTVLREFKPPHGREAPSWQPPAAPVLLRVDRNKLRQAIGNVLSNAYKYSPDGGAVEVRVPVSEGADGVNEVGIEVRDHGIGLTPAQLARVGERFYRADSSGRIAGTGLGMSIVKEITELLGGRLSLSSEPGQGTVVTLWLPASAASAARGAREVAA